MLSAEWALVKEESGGWAPQLSSIVNHASLQWSPCDIRSMTGASEVEHM